MDLIDEQDVAGPQVGKQTREVSRFFEHGAGGELDVHLEFVCEEDGERRLAKPRRTVEQRVVERVAAGLRGLDVYAQALLDLLLTHELRQTVRAERALVRALLIERLGCRDVGSGVQLGHVGHTVSCFFDTLLRERLDELERLLDEVLRAHRTAVECFHGPANRIVTFQLPIT